MSLNDRKISTVNFQIFTIAAVTEKIVEYYRMSQVRKVFISCSCHI